MKKSFVIIISEIIIILGICLFLRPVLELFNTYGQEEIWDKAVIHFQMGDNPDERSYGNEMRILYIEVNGIKYDLSAFETPDWVWHGEWGYLLYTDGERDFYVQVNEKIHNLDICCIKQEGGGRVRVYLDDKLIKDMNSYSGKWHNSHIHVSYLSRLEMVEKGIEVWILLTLLLLLSIRIVCYATGRTEKEKIKVGIGTFNFTKGLGIFIVVMIHSALCVLDNEDMASGSYIVAGCFLFFSYSLMSAFFLL